MSRLPGIVVPAAAAVGACAIGAFALLALTHVGDNYHVDHVTGAWMGLAQYADHGVFYPPLFEHGYFGGTRYGPLGVALNALGGEVTGEYLVSGKVLALVVMSALLAGVYLLCRELGAGRAIALGAVGAVIATFTAAFAGTTIYGDALAVTLQIWALVVVSRSATPRSLVVAGVLCGLAVTAKSTGVWGGVAVALWLLVRERRLLPVFAGAAVVSAAIVFAVAALASHGRLDENVLGLAGSGLEGVHHLFVDTPSKIWSYARHDAQATVVLTPLAVVAIAVACRRRRVELVDVAVVIAALVTLVVMTDVGTGFNHLLDLSVLVPIVVAARARAGNATLAVPIAVALAVATLASLFHLRHDVRAAATAAVHLKTEERLRTPALHVRLVQPYFSEDPSIPVERGQRPVALDSFMLLRIVRDHPQWKRQLIARFDRKEFTTVVLIEHLDLHDQWWSQNHLGLDVARAIARNYRFVRRERGPVFAYRLFAPR